MQYLEHDEIMALHDKAYNNGYDTRLKASDDLLFAWVTQWDDTYLNQSTLGYRGEFNILRKAMRQIITSLIANPVQVDFEPDEETDEDAADLLDGMYRSDTRNNRALEALRNSQQECVTCGVGAWEWVNEYKTNRMGDERQVLIRQPLYEANNNVFWDANAKLIDKSDADYVSCLVAYSKDGYEKLVEDLTGEEALGQSSFAQPERSYTFPWVQDERIYVCRFYHRKKVKVTYLTYADFFGNEQVVEKSKLGEYEDELFAGGFELVSKKQVERYIVCRYIVDGRQILSKDVIPGENIPVVPEYGERQFVEGQEVYEGIVRLAKDPQRLRNFQMSYLADIVSRSPREKPIFTAEQIQGFEDMYEENGADNNYPYLLQNAMAADGTPLPVGVVGGIKAPEVPPALAASMVETRMAVDDVASAGLPADMADVDLSGKAINAINKRLDMQSYTYQDNFKYAIRRDAEIYLSMIKDIKDTEESVTLVKVDGTKSKERINAQVTEYTPAGIQQTVKNDIQSMDFDVYADIGPAYESVKQENQEQIKELLNSGALDPEMHTILLNEYLTMIDGAAFKDLREYSRKKLIMMGVKEPETEEEMMMVQQAQMNQQPNAQEQALMAESQARLMEGQAAIQNEVNDANKIAIDKQKADNDTMKVMIDAQKAGVQIEKDQVETFGKQLDNAYKLMQPVNQM